MGSSNKTKIQFLFRGYSFNHYDYYIWTCNLWNSRNNNNNNNNNSVREFKYLGTTLANQNSIHEEIKSRLKSGNACYHLVQNLLSSSLLSENVNIKIYKTVILPVVLCGCETWSLTSKEVFENRVLRKIFGPKRYEVTR